MCLTTDSWIKSTISKSPQSFFAGWLPIWWTVFKRLSSKDVLPLGSQLDQVCHKGQYLVCYFFCAVYKWHFRCSPVTRNLFADDILLFKPIKSDFDFCNLQKDVDAINNWTVVTLNANKTKFMLISRNRKSQHPPLLLNGTQMEKVNHFKYLGIWLSADLTLSKHIDSVCCKVQRLLGYIYIALSPFTVFLSLFCIYIKPKFFPYSNMNALSGTLISKRTSYFYRTINVFWLELPPSHDPVTTWV